MDPLALRLEKINARVRWLIYILMGACLVSLLVLAFYGLYSVVAYSLYEWDALSPRVRLTLRIGAPLIIFIFLPLAAMIGAGIDVAIADKKYKKERETYLSQKAVACGITKEDMLDDEENCDEGEQWDEDVQREWIPDAIISLIGDPRLDMLNLNDGFEAREKIDSYLREGFRDYIKRTNPKWAWGDETPDSHFDKSLVWDQACHIYEHLCARRDAGR